MTLAAVLMRLNVPTRLICTTLAKKSLGMGPFLPSVRLAPSTPAQLTVRSTWPKASTALSTAATTFPSEVTSVLMNKAWSPNFFAAASPCSALTSSRAALPPAPMTRSAVASPSPEAPPEMMALRLENCMLWLLVRMARPRDFARGDVENYNGEPSGGSELARDFRADLSRASPLPQGREGCYLTERT